MSIASDAGGSMPVSKFVLVSRKASMKSLHEEWSSSNFKASLSQFNKSDSCIKRSMNYREKFVQLWPLFRRPVMFVWLVLLSSRSFPLSLSLFWLLWFEKENKSISSAECLRTKFISFVRLLYINCFLKETSIFYLLFQLKRKKFREEEALRRGSLRKVWRISKTSVYYDVPLCFIHWQQ